MELALEIIKYVFGKILTVAGIVFAILYIAKHKKLEEFFNKRAGMTILPSRIIGKVEKITFGLGAVVGVMQWFEALSGDLFMGTVNIIALCAGVIYLYKMYKRLSGTLNPIALKWLLIYKGCTLWMFFVGGALLSIVAILLLVMLPTFAKGANYVWNEALSGGASTCRNCKYWDNGYCALHNTAMPTSGSCDSRS